MAHARPTPVWDSPAARSLCEFCDTDNPVAAITGLAAELVKESQLTRPGQKLALLASLQDARIEECEMSDAGRLVPSDEGFTIQVNEAHSEGRKHFSTCHEIGHLLIPSYHTAPQAKVDVSTGDYAIDAQEEFLCDTAAAELLLPTAEFAQALRQAGVKIESIELLASEFGASLEATALKLARCGICDVAVIVWELDWKPTQKKDLAIPSLPFAADEIPEIPKALRIKFACGSGVLGQHLFPKDKSVSADSIVYETYANGHLSRGPVKFGSKGRETSYYMESQAFPYWADETLERKVISLVFPGR